jgi:D-aminopeptidase
MSVATISESELDSIFAGLGEGEAPGAAVGVALRGRPVYRKAFGVAAAGQPGRLSPSRPMRIGSTTKHFACFAYALLCERGLAGLDDPVGRHLPQVHPVAREVTMRQLMQNVGGLRDVIDLNWQFSGPGPVTSQALLSLYSTVSDRNAPPDTGWIYNNGGFLMVSAVIEKITGRLLEQVIEEEICVPLGLSHTALRRTDASFEAGTAHLHAPDGAGGFRVPAFGTELAGEGGMVSTVDDMLAWLRHMDAPVLGSAETWAAMTTPPALPNGEPTGYGFGLMCGAYRGLDILHHPGGLLGGSAQMLKVPGAGLDLIVIVNRSDVSAIVLANSVLDACFKDAVSPAAYSTAAFPEGVFQSPTTGRVIQLRRSDGALIASMDGTDAPVEQDAAGVLRPTATSAYLRLQIEPLQAADGAVSLRLTDFGSTDELVAVSNPPTPVDVLAGRYVSPTTGIEVAFEADPTPSLRTFGQFGSVRYRLEHLAGDVWRARLAPPAPWGGVISFAADGRSLTYSNSFFTRNLEFRRLP